MDDMVEVEQEALAKAIYEDIEDSFTGIDDIDISLAVSKIMVRINQARIAEREACAKVCDHIASLGEQNNNIGVQAGSMLSAKQIRNRGRIE